MVLTATLPGYDVAFLRKPICILRREDTIIRSGKYFPSPFITKARKASNITCSSFPRLEAHERITRNFITSNQTLPLFNFEEYTALQRAKVNKALDEAVPLQDPLEIYQAMRYSLLAGGKRLRPLLCLASCELVGGEEAQVMPIACAIEMVHTTTVIHDDLPSLDDDPLRRGKPTNHTIFGEATAILAGDALTCMAFSHAATQTKNVSLQRIAGAIAELGNGAGSKGVAAGQVLDMASTGKEVSLKRLKNIHMLKAAKIIEASIVCGALVGGADAVSVQRLRSYSRSIGLLFQVVDDILDVTMSSEELGKTAGKDLVTNKATYPRLLGLEEAKKFAGKLLDQAHRYLACFDPVKAAPLTHLANYVANRTN